MNAPVASGGAALASAAARMVGAPFRLHGRDPATGIDCVGLVCVSLAAIGIRPAVPSGYGLRNLAVDTWLVCAGQSGLVAAEGPMAAGDVLLLRLGHGQHHCVIADHEAAVIHADVGLRRVVRQPVDPAWVIAAHWRLSPDHLKV